MGKAFENTRVIDLSRTLAGAWAARQFGDYGADVILAEPHPLRREPPFVEGRSGEDASLLHAYANWNKRSVAPEHLVELARTADVLVTTAAPPWGEDLTAIVEALPQAAVHLSITPHGVTGPLARVPGEHLTHCARSGWSYVNSLENEPPLQLPPRQSGYIAGIAGFVAAAAAHYRALETGIGETVDASELEALASTSAPWAILGIFFNAARLEYGPGGPRSRRVSGPLWETADGLINYGFGEWANWRKAMALFGLPEIGTDPRYEPVTGRHGQDLRPVVKALAEASKTRNKWALFHGLAELHCISGVVQNAAELTSNEQLQARGFFVETLVMGRRVQAPGPAARLSASSWHLERGAPTLGQDWPDDGIAAHRSNVAINKSKKGRPPLEGVRVLTFTQAWSGTFGTEILSLLGADVVQIEGRKRPDVWRGNGAPVPRAVLDPERDQSPLNTNGMYNSVNLNKRAITLDMTDPRGRRIFWKMLPAFDILAENFSPKVMANWGITMEALQQVRPDIIFASLSGYGQDGPLSRYPANGNTTEPMSGLSSVNGYDGDAGANTGGLIPDPISGYYFAGAILAALAYRRRTGEGQRIDVSMVEAVAVQLGDHILDYIANGRVARPEGNRHPTISPHNVYTTDDDRWVAISTLDEDQWHTLAGIMNLHDEKFAVMSARKQHEAELDEKISAWCRSRTAEEIETRLVNAGICAAVVRRFLDVYRNPPDQFLSREYLVPVTHPESGTHRMPTLPWVLTRTESMPIRHSPRFGEHSREVFGEELGMADETYENLEAAGITGTERL